MLKEGDANLAGDYIREGLGAIVSVKVRPRLSVFGAAGEGFDECDWSSLRAIPRPRLPTAVARLQGDTATPTALAGALCSTAQVPNPEFEGRVSAH